MGLFERRKRISGAEMSFVDHLEELRGHVVRSILAILIVAIAIFIYRDWLFDNFITAPVNPDFFTYKALCNISHSLHIGDALCMPPIKINMQSTTFGGQFMSSITMAFVGGLIISFPYVFWEFWRFVKPALSENELKGTRFVIFWVSFFFFLGAAFGFYLLGPFTFNFLASFQLGTKGMVVTIPTFTDYLDNLTNIILGCGLAFELPVMAYALTKIGLITPQFLKNSRKYAVVVLLVVAAVITPSPDWMSQLLVFIPLWLLYELSVWVSGRVAKKEEEKERQWS